MGWFYAVPLCREHHLSQGAEREDIWFDKHLDGGIAEAYSWVLSAILEICEEDTSIQCIREYDSAEDIAREIYDILLSCEEKRRSQ